MRAAELGRDDAVALAAAGFALADVCHRLETGDAMIDRALDLNPNLASTWIYRGWVKLSLGEPEVALECIANARRLSPNDPQKFSFHGVTTIAQVLSGHFAEACVSAEAVTRDLPRFLTSQCLATVSAALAGRMADAQRALALALQIDPTLRVSNVDGIFYFRRPQDAGRWVEGFRKAGLPE